VSAGPEGPRWVGDVRGADRRPVRRRVVPHVWRYAVPGALAVAASAVGQVAGDLRGTPREVTIAVVCALVLVVAVILLVRAAAAGLSALAERHGGESAATLAQTGTLAVGGLVLLLAVLDVLQVSVRSLLVGGALTGVVLGIALQQVLGNVFAGLVLLLTRPYAVGDLVRLRGGTTGGVLEGRVVGATLTHQVLRTEEGVLRVPNASALGAVIGPTSSEGPLRPVFDPTATDDPDDEGGDGPGAGRPDGGTDAATPSRPGA
jgi:small-conductance mechanosensitive channel